jgi:hypothetical protein
MGRLGVSGIPHAFLVDAQGKIVWDGHPGELSDAIIQKALGGALPKPLFDFPSGAAAVRTALAKHNYAAAMAEAEKLPEGQGGADLKKSLQGMISGRVASMHSALKQGDFLTAVELGTALKKDLAGLPEAPEADKVLDEVKGNKEAEPVIAAQKKIRAMAEQKLGKKTDFERAMGDLKKIAADLKGTFAAKEAEDTSAMLTKRRQQSR